MVELRTGTLKCSVSVVIFSSRTPTYMSQIAAGYKVSGLMGTSSVKTISTLKLGGSDGVGAVTLDGLR